MAVGNATAEITAAAVGVKSIAMPVFGLYNFEITGTFTGTVLLLRRPLELYSLGAHSGSADAAALVTAAMSTPHGVAIADAALVGMYVSNDTDGSIGVITNNVTATGNTTITATLAGGTQNDWDVGDKFSLWSLRASHTAVTSTQYTEPETGVSVMAYVSALASGALRCRIGQ